MPFEGVSIQTYQYIFVGRTFVWSNEVIARSCEPYVLNHRAMVSDTYDAFATECTLSAMGPRLLVKGLYVHLCEDFCDNAGHCAYVPQCSQNLQVQPFY